MESRMRKAVMLYKQGKKERAAKLLQQIVLEDPSNPTAWYGLALSLEDVEKKIYCLKRVVSLDPSHEKAQKLLSKLQNDPRKSTNTAHIGKAKVASVAHQISTPEKVFWIVLLSIIGVLVFLIADDLYSTHQAEMVSATATHQAKMISATATADYQLCLEQFDDEMLKVLSRFFRQADIADVTPRINLPEQIARLEDIRQEAWDLPQKWCRPRTHALLMDYMDKSIAMYISFSGEEDIAAADILAGVKYIQALKALAALDDDVIRHGHRGGLVELFRSKGYFYWEGLDDPEWKKKVQGQ